MMYEPIGGTAFELTGKGLANPVRQRLSPHLPAASAAAAAAAAATAAAAASSHTFGGGAVGRSRSNQRVAATFFVSCHSHRAMLRGIPFTPSRSR